VVYMSDTSKFEMFALAIFIGVIAGLTIEALLSHLVGYASFGYNLTIAAVSAVSGAFLVLLGMIFLLLLKGANPLKHVSANPKLYLIVLFAMAVFGTFEQLIFCTKKGLFSGRRKKAARETAPETDGAPAQKSSWRNK